jgi:hypothetical protein
MDREIFENWFHVHFVPSSVFPERERITTESSVPARQCPFSFRREHTGC